jgi:hypothetical protein
LARRVALRQIHFRQYLAGFELGADLEGDGPKAVGARSTLMDFPSASQPLGVAKSRRSVSGVPSLSRSKSCTNKWRKTQSHWALLALLGGQ